MTIDELKKILTCPDKWHGMIEEETYDGLQVRALSRYGCHDLYYFDSNVEYNCLNTLIDLYHDDVTAIRQVMHDDREWVTLACGNGDSMRLYAYYREGPFIFTFLNNGMLKADIELVMEQQVLRIEEIVEEIDVGSFI